MLKICVCVSGGGTNLQAIMDAIDTGKITNTQIVQVISNNKNAYALERARNKGIAAKAVSPKDFENREHFNEAFLACLDAVNPDLIFYGLMVHEAALERGVKITGATVHYVDAGTDTGPIILQKAVEVLQDDTPETLQRRVMEEAEWQILPQAIQMIANGNVEN